MALIKKTAVLTNNGAEGYITVVRVGDEVGAKIVGASFEKGMLAAVKIGAGPVIYAKLDDEKTEINMNVNFNHNDEISCLILKGENLVAKAGRTLSKTDLIAYFAKDAPTFGEQTMTEPDTTVMEESQNNDSASEMGENPVEMPKTEHIDEEMIQYRPFNRAAAQNTENDAPDIIAPTVIEKESEEIENIDTETEKEFLSKLNTTGTKNFYLSVKERLDDLFVIHPRETELEKLIPESKWVKIRYDGEDYYVVGALSDNGTVVYLGYGVPGVPEVAPPKLASEISDWLPVPNLPSPYKGYWLIFQNAEDGKVGNIK